MRLEELEILTTVEVIFFKNFKEKIAITTKYDKKRRIQVYDDFVVTEEKRYEG